MSAVGAYEGRVARHRVTAVTRCLEDHLDGITTRQLMAQTCYSRSSVETALAFLRRTGSDCVKNFRYERCGRGPVAYKPRDELIRERPEPAEPPKPDAAKIVAQALATRTDLERAWG